MVKTTAANDSGCGLFEDVCYLNLLVSNMTVPKFVVFAVVAVAIAAVVVVVVVVALFVCWLVSWLVGWLLLLLLLLVVTFSIVFLFVLAVFTFETTAATKTTANNYHSQQQPTTKQ